MYNNECSFSVSSKKVDIMKTGKEVEILVKENNHEKIKFEECVAITRENKHNH